MFPVSKQRVRGEVSVPGDKSISHRALLLSAVSPGESRITGLSRNRDVMATRTCLKTLGLAIRDEGKDVIVSGRPFFSPPENKGILDAQNSGTTMRLLAGLLCAQPFESRITGDDSLRRRPMKRIIDPLRTMGADISGDRDNRYAPLLIRPAAGGLYGIHYEMPMASAQVKSAVLLAGLYATGDIGIVEPEPSRDHTERMLTYMGAELQYDDAQIHMKAKQIDRLQPRDWDVPGDPSSAAFLVAAAISIPGSDLLLKNIGLNPYRIGMLTVLKEAGAHIEVKNEHTRCGEPVGDLHVRASSLRGHLHVTAETVPALVDELPILAACALYLNGSLTVTGAEELRLKESDRITALETEFAKLGIDIVATEGGFTVSGNPARDIPPPAETLDAHGDHRIAMALWTLSRIAAARSGKPADWPMGWKIRGEEAMDVSFPGFKDVLNHCMEQGYD